MTTSNAKSYEYKAEMKQLLHLIVHSLYTHPEIFLRELISNASDALNKVRFEELRGDADFLNAGEDLSIKISLDSEKNIFSIEDNGIGMTEEDLIKNLGTVAKSGTLEFLKTAQESDTKDSGDLIGQFGVGFYSVFMVTNSVTVETRHASKDSVALRWTSNGEGSFEIEEIEKSSRGTKISFELSEDYKSFAEESHVKNTIQKYSNFVEFPIQIGEEKVNTISALWRKQSQDIKKEEANEFYKFISSDFNDSADYLHINLEGNVNFKALLFLPSKRPFDLSQWREMETVQLYSNKVMIQDSCKELLPEYLWFIRGVVDTSDLPLNVSREMIQDSPVLAQIRGTLTKRILAWFKKLADKKPELYTEFYQQFGPIFKSGMNTDFANRDKLVDLLRFYSLNFPQNLISFKDYVAKAKEDQKEIYFMSGPTQEALLSNPKLEFFKKNEIDVLLLVEPIDIFIMQGVPTYDEKPVKSIERSDIEAFEKSDVEASDNDLNQAIIKKVKEVLGEDIENVKISKRLVDSPLALVAGENSVDPQMERILKMMNPDTPVPPSKKIVELNPEHKIVQNIGKMILANYSDPMIEKYILQLYDTARFVDGELPSTKDFVARMHEIMASATD